MQTITLEDLKQQVQNQKTEIDSPHIVALLSVDGCQHCMAFKNLLLPIVDDLSSRNIVFYYLQIGQNIPLFAPNVYPSLVCFSKGVRIWEGLGAVDSAELVKQSLLFRIYGEEPEQWLG